MAIDQESFNTRLYELLKVRGYSPVPKNSKNERSNPQQADVFEFTFKKDGKDYGKAWATIDQAAQLKLYYDEEQAGSPPGKTKGLEYDDSWSGFLKHLKQWTLSKQLDFDLQDSDRLGDDMRQRDYYKMKEKMNEGYHPINKQTSYSDSVPNVKIIIQHDKKLEEGDQRFRNIAKIFVENTEGERFVVPTKRPGIARVYGRHVAEGGTPYDERGRHITQLVEEYTKMAGFVRATKNGEFTESVQQLVNEGVKHHQSLKETLQKMQSHRGYNHYFESWTPTLLEDESDPAIAEMFSRESIDPRIESVLPILNKLNKHVVSEMSEVNELAAWAEELTEGEAEKRDTHCSDKCCGSDVKREDCNCPPDCKGCNCNAKLNESQSSEPSISQMSDEDLAEYVFKDTLDTPDAYKKAVMWVKKNREEAEEAANEISADHAEPGEDDLYEGKVHLLIINGKPISKYADINDAERDFKYMKQKYPKHNIELKLGDDPANKENKPGMLGEEGLLSDNEIAEKVGKFISSLGSKDKSEKASIIKEKIKWLKQEATKTKDSARLRNLGLEAKMLSSYLESGEIPNTGGQTAYDAAVASAEKRVGRGKENDGEGPTKGHVSIARALAGLAGMMGYGPGAALVEKEEQVDEFDMSGWDDDRPKKYNPRLVDKDTGEEIKLPATLKDFRGDEVIIVDFQAPHKPSSTGRVYTKDGNSFFPSVVNAKIVDHEWDDPDNLDEDLDADQKRVGQLGPTEKVKNNNIGKLVGNESVDPYAEGSWVGDADRVYHLEGEDALAEFLKMTPEELDQLINEKGHELGKHADDDREELIFKVVQDLDDNRDVKDYGSAMRELEESTKALQDIMRLINGSR